MAKKKATGLYSDQRGRIACKEHAPYEGTDTWTFDQWKPMTAAEAARLRERGRASACVRDVRDGNYDADGYADRERGASDHGRRARC